MRQFTVDGLLADYQFLRRTVAALTDDAFAFMTPPECEAERRDLLEELRTDYAFKLLTKLEADIRLDFNRTLVQRLRDGVSRAYTDLCRAYRQETRAIRQPLAAACSRIPVDRVLEALRDHFRQIDEDFHRVCSATRGYFKFRHWYAHGRFFQPVPLIPDPEDVADVYDLFEQNVMGR